MSDTHTINASSSVAANAAFSASSSGILAHLFELNLPTKNHSVWWNAKFQGGLLILLLTSLLSLGMFFTDLTLLPFLVAKLILLFLISLVIAKPLFQTTRLPDHKTLTYLPVFVTCCVALAALVEALSRQQIFNDDFWSLLLFDLPALLLPLAARQQAERSLLKDAVLPDLNVFEKLRVEKSRLIKSGKVTEVPTSFLNPGDVILIPAGEKIPRDGTVIKGTTSVDEFDLTGEDRPLLKEIGDRVVGGSLNRDSDIQVRVEKNRESDVLEELIARTQSSKHSLSRPSPELRLAERFAIWGSFFIAAATCSLSHFIFHRPVSMTIASSLSLFALLPAGSSFLSRLASLEFLAEAWQRGVVFSGENTLPLLGSVSSLYFNKTETLSLGDFLYSQNFIETGTNQGEMLSFLFSIESGSKHPLAEAMQSHPWYVEVPKSPIKHFQEFPGLGISAYVTPRSGGSYQAIAGNLRFAKRMRMGISREMRAKIEDLEEMGETVILCGYDRQVQGIMSFADTLRRGIRRTLRKIRELGIETVLITGDTEKTVTQLTGNLGIDKIHSRCTPEEKAEKIKKEKESGKIVALMDNDFKGDAPALAEADLTLCIDTGTNIADHSVDIVVMNSDISLLYWIFKKSRQIREALVKTSRGHLTLFTLTAIVASLGLAIPQIFAAASYFWSTMAFKLLPEFSPPPEEVRQQ